MKLTPRFYFLVTIWIFAGCAIYNDISVNSDALVDFSKYSTFAWLPDDSDTTDSPYNNVVIRNNLKNYFGRSLVERGFTADLKEPDLLLQISVRNKHREVTFGPYPRRFYFCRYYYGSDYYSPYPFNCYYNYGYCYPPDCVKEQIIYVEGSITFKVIDRKQNKLVWSATAKGDIYDPAFINRSIHPAVIHIMKRFPLKPLPYQKKKALEDELF